MKYKTWEKQHIKALRPRGLLFRTRLSSKALNNWPFTGKLITFPDACSFFFHWWAHFISFSFWSSRTRVAKYDFSELELFYACFPSIVLSSKDPRVPCITSKSVTHIIQRGPMSKFEVPWYVEYASHILVVRISFGFEVFVFLPENVKVVSFFLSFYFERTKGMSKRILA